MSSRFGLARTVAFIAINPSKVFFLKIYNYLTATLHSGGIGEAVAGVLSNADFITKHKILAVREIPRSGPSAVLLDMFGISANKVVDAVLDMVE